MLIAQITDLHVAAPGCLAYGRVDTSECLSRAVSALLSLSPKPNVILVTGDLTNCGQAAEYENLRTILKPLSAPIYVVPGNHDDRTALATAFADHAYLNKNRARFHYTVETWPLRLIGIDTAVPGEAYGSLGEDDLTWLHNRLSEQPFRPTLLFMHHPPIRTGIDHMDAVGLRPIERFAEIVGLHRQIVRIVCGHVHRPVQASFVGTAVSIAPSVAHQILLDVEAGSPGRYVLEPPGYQLHLWAPDSGITTHTAVIGTFDGPYSLTMNDR